MKVPGIRTLTTNYEILGGPATALVIAASTKYREANPKSYKAFFDALKEAIDTINKDKRAAAKDLSRAGEGHQEHASMRSTR